VTGTKLVIRLVIATGALLVQACTSDAVMITATRRIALHATRWSAKAGSRRATAPTPWSCARR